MVISPTFRGCALVWLPFSAACLLVVVSLPARAQNGPLVINGGEDFGGGISGGVYIDADGTVRQRAVDSSGGVAAVRARGAVGPHPVKKDAKLCFVSLPKLTAEVRDLIAAGKPVPDELRYLGGIAQLQYVLVYPQEKDLVIAGPAEPFDSSATLQPLGKVSGRPVLQLEDLVVALRNAGGRVKPKPFGCSIDPPPGAQQTSHQVMRQYGQRPRAELIAAMTGALGPQQVRVFGMPPETRAGFILVAADYRLKRLALGMDRSPVAGLGSAVDNSRSAGNRFWFEAMYEPLLVSPDGSGYQLRGQRLRLEAGALQFDARGATETAKAWARSFTQKMGALAAAEPLFADLQNLADLGALAALVRHDGLDRKAGWDFSWLLETGAFPVRTLPVPRTAETLVCVRNGALASGGVRLDMEDVVDEPSRETDRTGEVDKARGLLDKARKHGGSGASILFAP